MSERARNMAVGLTVIIALMMLAGMILIFTGLPEMFQRGYELKIRLSGSGGVHVGDDVHLNGIVVGKIIKISFTNDDPTIGVTLTAKIDKKIKLPGTSEVVIYKSYLTNSSYVDIHTSGPPRIDPKTGEVMLYLPTDRATAMEGRVVGSDPFDALNDAVSEIKSLFSGDQEDKTATATGEEGAGPTTAPKAKGLKGTLARLDATLDSVKQFADEAKKTASTANKRVDDLAGKLITTAEGISALMATMNRIALKIESGEGTAGKLLNDPDLYNNFLEASKQMAEMLKQFRELAEKWEKQGVEIKVKS